MSTEKNNNQFREDEIVIMSHVDKRTGEVVTRPYPKVGGRLRLAHEENGNLSISTEIIRYEDNVVVVKAQATTSKGTFNGLGMASLERDQRIAPAILELWNTVLQKRSLTWKTEVLSSRTSNLRRSQKRPTRVRVMTHRTPA
jgi:hypothetical protein